MTARRIAAAAAIVCGAVQAQPDDGWALSVRYDRHADALAMRDFGDDGAEKRLVPRGGDNVAWIDDEVRAGRRVGAWTWSVLGRARATLEASEDALALVDQVSNKKSPSQDRHFDVAARLRGFSGWGLALARDSRLAERWSLRVEAQALQLARWQDRDITGRVDYRGSARSYAFSLESDESNDRREFPFQKPHDDRGAALLLNATLAWRGDDWRASATLRDLGWLHWSRLPRQRATLNSETARVDADGYLVYEPLIKGRNSQHGRTELAAPDAIVEAAWRVVPQTELQAGAWWIAGLRPLPRFGVTQRVGKDWTFGARWGVHERRVGVDAGWHGWKFGYAADRLGDAARSRMVAVSYGIAY